jgi:hypothetical protein
MVPHISLFQFHYYPFLILPGGLDPSIQQRRGFGLLGKAGSGYRKSKTIFFKSFHHLQENLEMKC